MEREKNLVEMLGKIKKLSRNCQKKVVDKYHLESLIFFSDFMHQSSLNICLPPPPPLAKAAFPADQVSKVTTGLKRKTGLAFIRSGRLIIGI